MLADKLKVKLGKRVKSFLFLLSFSILGASSYPEFKKDEVDNIEKKSGIIAKNRIIDYSEILASLEALPKEEQLLRVNFYLNQLPFRADIVNYQNNDYWGTPKEFLTTGYGDCEDYAIIKYFTLLKLGFSKEKLFITASREKYTGQLHMVLSYFESDNKPPLILDSLSYKVLDLATRVDLEPSLFINEDGSFQVDDYHNLVKVGDVPQKFKELIQRVKNDS